MPDSRGISFLKHDKYFKQASVVLQGLVKYPVTGMQQSRWNPDRENHDKWRIPHNNNYLRRAITSDEASLVISIGDLAAAAARNSLETMAILMGHLHPS